MHTARWWQLFPECWITYGQENFLHVWFGQLVPVTPFKTVNGIWKPRNQACIDKLTTLIWVLLQCLKPQHEQTGALTSQLKTEKDREKQNEGYLTKEISTKFFWESKNIWEHSGNFGLFPAFLQWKLKSLRCLLMVTWKLTLSAFPWCNSFRIIRPRQKMIEKKETSWWAMFTVG